MSDPPRLEYGAFIRAEDHNHQLLVTIPEEDFRRTLKMLLIQANGDSDEALRILKQRMIERLRR